MSVVVWDGKTLAADKSVICADMIYQSRKIIARDNVDGIEVVAWTGDSDFGRELAEWYFDGAKKETWPEYQMDKDKWSRLIVASHQGCFFYEMRPVKIEVLSPFLAWGSGRDFAMGALAMGADARKAVEVANQFAIHCGFGVEAYDI